MGTSTTGGHWKVRFEKSGNKCPHTGESMTMQDVIDIRTDKPRRDGSKASNDGMTSVATMLQHVSDEWEAKNEENEQLRHMLQTTRQEIATALYGLDAAHRVLVKERISIVESGDEDVQAKVINGDGGIANQRLLQDDNNSDKIANNGVDKTEIDKVSNGVGGSAGLENSVKETKDETVRDEEEAIINDKWPAKLMSRVQELGWELMSSR